ncbi:GSCFA domain-containing protein [Urechidicola vernalis]|uniref:GSCFA domain-containing protein n=1 Tax=Urechidicola vernalis TaxID=3075600 RepID=A0ABU2Y8K8_9FLAO|nr:GSCFA domain-containing protein [Urechidicola sp. P050]MDT0553408.1 GSCFA domain-containing protein [Urechidicola sp. P050]
MNFRTSLPVKPVSIHQIDYNANILLLGSCFAENIGSKLDYFRFENLMNPFGILFHPKAIENLITKSINQYEYTQEDIFFHNEQWHCFEAHSDLSAPSKENLLEELNTNIQSTYKYLNNATHIVITLGTAWAYRYISSDNFVANCHKVPQKKFLKELLSVEDIDASLECINTLLKSINPKVNIIYTVSPVRHLKDGFTENSLSKAHLLSAVHQVVEPRNSLYYFPAYEIMMDDLRDYRFYKSDMIHPNQTAIDYIWEQFKTVWISDSADNLMNEIDTVQKGLAHKPFNENSEQHQQFLKNLRLKIKELQESRNINF